MQQLGEMPGVGIQRLGQAAQANPARLHAHVRPQRLRGTRRGNGFGRLAGTTQRHAADRLARCRIGHVEETIAHGQEGTTVDPEGNGLRAFGSEIHAQALFLAAYCSWKVLPAGTLRSRPAVHPGAMPKMRMRPLSSASQLR